jgi:hypothetical protein
MEYPDITHLYKYRAFNIHSRSMLTTRKVWLAKPESFNDPFDCKMPFDANLTVDDLIEYCRRTGTPKETVRMLTNAKGEVVKEFIEKWAEELRKLDEELQNYGVFSLSASNNNILLWAHYADGHKGFCIEYLRSSDNQLGNYEMTRKVKYPPDYPVVKSVGKEAFDIKFFTKASDWEYEQEWRLIYDQGNVEQSLPGVDISAVIFGLEMPESHKQEIRKATSDLTNIRYHQVVKLPMRFELGFVDV